MLHLFYNDVTFRSVEHWLCGAPERWVFIALGVIVIGTNDQEVAI